MTNQNLPAAPVAAQLPAAVPSFDAHGFDPDDFEWVPLPRQPRRDGWCPDLQRKFIEALADSGSVTQAAKRVNMTTMSCYRLRRQPGAENFAAAWEAALAESARTLVDIAFDRAINGVEEPVLNRDGDCIYVRTRVNDRLLMFLLRAHHPDKYDPNVPRTTAKADAKAGAGAALDAALATLEPVAPVDPLQLLSPQRFADLLPLKQPDDEDDEAAVAVVPAATPAELTARTAERRRALAAYADAKPRSLV
ncbi:MAG: hypothetical protein ACRCUI_10370 [Polymorphobacter sp.]